MENVKSCILMNKIVDGGAFLRGKNVLLFTCNSMGERCWCLEGFECP